MQRPENLAMRYRKFKISALVDAAVNAAGNCARSCKILFPSCLVMIPRGIGQATVVGCESGERLLQRRSCECYAGITYVCINY